MNSLMLTLAVAGVFGDAVAERTVIAPKDDKPFSVVQTDRVRLTAKGIAGSKFEIKVDGPATVEAINVVQEFANGRPLIGTTTKEFDLKPNGAGNVTAIVTVTPPQPNSKAKVTKYEFEVK